MGKGIVQIYFGAGHGKSTAALGEAIRAASEGKSVTMIEFLKGRQEEKVMYMGRLEPEIKFFRFAKSDESFEKLSDEAKKEEVMNLRNGFNYGKKVAATEGCDLLVLDEVLGLVDEGVISAEEMCGLLESRPEEVSVICTGRVLPDALRKYADEIYNITVEK